MNIITALKNPKINIKLKEKSNFNIIGTDIQYQEGIIEMLEKNRKIDLIIISELLPGELTIINLISKIKKINDSVKIFIILKDKNQELENYLISKGVFNIFYNNKITVDELIDKINLMKKDKQEMEINEELINIKNIILEKNKINKNSKINKIRNNILNKIKEKTTKKHEIFENKIISVIGTGGIGKTSFCVILSKLIKNKKILIIDFDILNSCINSVFGIKKYSNKTNENNILEKNIKKLITKVNKNIDIFCGTKILVDEKYKNLKENFYNFLNEIKNKYDLIIIDNSSECFFEYTKQILNKSDLIMFLLEPNIIDLKKSKNLLNIYINKWKIKKEKINIVFNKVNKNSIDEEVLKTLFMDFKILGKLKIDINYNLILNKHVKIINKKIKKDYLKIIKKLEFI